jgi:hypothetical protein
MRKRKKRVNSSLLYAERNQEGLKDEIWLRGTRVPEGSHDDSSGGWVVCLVVGVLFLASSILTARSDQNTTTRNMILRVLTELLIRVLKNLPVDGKVKARMT